MAAPTSTFDSPTALRVFIGELALGALLLLLVLATVAFAPSIRRSALSVNVYLAFLVYSLSYLLLAITGQLNNDQPPFALCLSQAMLQYASFPLCGAVVLALSVQIWLNVFWPSTDHIVLNRLLLFGPLGVWATVMIEVLVIGLSFRDQVVRIGMPYCFVQQPIPGVTSRILLALLLLPSMIFQGLTFRPLFAARATPLAASAEHRRALRHRLARMCVFSAGSLGALGLTLAFSVQTSASAATVLVQGACPLWAVLVFGTQREMFAVWLCRPPRKAQSESEVEFISEAAKA